MLCVYGTVISKLEGPKEMKFYSDLLSCVLNKAMLRAANKNLISGFGFHWLPAASLPVLEDGRPGTVEELYKS